MNSSNTSLESLIPTCVLRLSGKKAYGQSKWLDQEQLTLAIDDDWATPLFLLKVISYGDPRGTHLGLWYGQGILKPMPVVFSGRDYGAHVRPLGVDPQSLCSDIAKVGSPRYIKPLFSERGWERGSHNLVPSLDASDLEVEFLKSPLFIRNGTESGGPYADFLVPHAEIARRIRSDKSKRDSLVASLFQKDEDITNYLKWLELSEVLRRRESVEPALAALEASVAIHNIFGPGKSGFPETVFIQRDYMLSRIAESAKAFPEWVQRIIAIKGQNLQRLSANTFNKIKGDNPEKYLELIQKGFSAR